MEVDVSIKIEQALATFSGKQIEETKTLLHVLRKKNISIDQFLLWKKERKISEKESLRGNKRCPKCRTVLFLQGICTKKGPGNKFGWKSLWDCSSCLWYEYSLLSPEEEKNRFRRKG